MKVSLCASAAKPQYWERLYKSVGNPKCEFEFVFVGPNDPLDPKYGFPKLPDNFKFIKSNVKPSQCFEIAARFAIGDFIMCLFDDAEFYGNNGLDVLLQRFYENIDCENPDAVIISPRYRLNGQDFSHSAHHLFVQNPGVILPIAGLMTRKFFFESGGVDKNFIGVMWDVDLGLRAWEAGGKCVLADVYINELKDSPDSFPSEVWKHDREYLESLWSDHPELYLEKLKRTIPVESFPLNDDLTIKSVGPTFGRWP